MLGREDGGGVEEEEDVGRGRRESNSTSFQILFSWETCFVTRVLCLLALQGSLTLSFLQAVYSRRQFLVRACLGERFSEPETFILINLLHHIDRLIDR